MTTRDEAIAQIRADLKRRSGKTWSVTGGRGTGWGWIHIGYPPARRCFQVDGVTPYTGAYGYASLADREELGRLLGLSGPAHCQYESVPASDDYRREYLDRAAGRPPSVHAEPYWD